MAELIVPIFRVADASVSASWYHRLGFEVTGEHRFAPGMPVYMFLARGDVQLHLSEHTGDARPGTLVYLWVDDVEAVAGAFGTEVETQPWARETTLIDPDGNRIRVATAATGD